MDSKECNGLISLYPYMYALSPPLTNTGPRRLKRKCRRARLRPQHTRRQAATTPTEHAAANSDMRLALGAVAGGQRTQRLTRLKSELRNRCIASAPPRAHFRRNANSSTATRSSAILSFLSTSNLSPPLHALYWHCAASAGSAGLACSTATATWCRWVCPLAHSAAYIPA